MTDIDGIIVASLTGEASDEELVALREWRAADLRNEREYRARVDAWAMFGTLVEGSERRWGPSTKIASRLEDESSTDEAREESDWRQRTITGGARPGLNWRRVTVAASLVLSMGVGVGLGRWFLRESYGPQTLVTGANEVATVTLADETVVRLAPESRLEFSRDSRQRQVSLTGRAYFAVSHRDGEPFRIRVPTGTVEVLGTRFEVQNREGATRVAVVEGEVRVRSSGGRVKVSANEIAQITTRGQLQVERVDDVFQVVDWLGRFLAFESTPLRDVAAEFHERFGIEFDIRDDALFDRTVTGWFSDQSVDEMIIGICAVVGVECAIGDGVVRMDSKSWEATGASADRPELEHVG